MPGSASRVEPNAGGIAKRPRTEVGYLRKRAIAACRLCRARKVKCNNARPACGACETSLAPCDYDDPSDCSSYDPASIAILDRLSQVLARLDQLPAAATSFSQAGTSPSCSTPQAVYSGPDLGSAQQQQQLLLRDQLSYDELRIPGGKTTPEAVLDWPILSGRHPAGCLLDAVFEAELCDEDEEGQEGNDSSGRTKSSRSLRPTGPNEDDIPILVQRFLELVHIKNPVLDVSNVLAYARRIAEDGIGWNSSSCLVLLICALGSIARPFPELDNCTVSESTTSLQAQHEELSRGEAYYNLACRRFGLLGQGLLSPQCHFFAGVYLMYTMRPLKAWSQFHQASQSYHLYLRCRIRRPNQIQNPSARRLEQRLYWSCYKSECELRAELNLPNSSLTDFHYPDMHPSPPDLTAQNTEIIMGSSFEDSSPRMDTLATLPANQRRTMELCRSQEESWFYYLTEITLRRIANRILNTFYHHGHESWTHEAMPGMIIEVKQFEDQLDAYLAQLPPPIQYVDDGPLETELPYMVRGRVYEIRLWLYRPFFFYAIHNPVNAPCRAMVQLLVDKAVLWHFRLVRCGPIRHRHHGAWAQMRATTAASLCILAAAESGNIAMPPINVLKEEFRDMIGRMRYWTEEVPGALESVKMIEKRIIDLCW
ncbi:hypothetical protein LTR10_007571 [Elasticomyces elasticus]|nr:hypothetical protein LTR10_007571 [Elasticomyces elasticus]KAK4970575.1 hypothetical protein LTR42_007550 [Elasticomyces elasticus]